MNYEGTYLAKILARTASDLVARKKQRPLQKLQVLARAAPKSVPFEQSLRRAAPARIIAEIKRRSPSQGFLDRDLDVPQTATDYEVGGAAALSVLTEGPNFAGTIEDIGRARQGSKLPILRKDFIVDEYQVVEARAFGASAVLLIVAALDNSALTHLLKVAREFTLDVLVEVHDQAELDRALDSGAAIVGINNRDLTSFKVDLATTEKLAPMAAKAGVLVVAESGIKTPDDVRRLATAGAEAFLVGESFITAGDRAAAVRALVESRRSAP